MFNPASAFPKQTTFTPQVQHAGHPQRAINAPNWAPTGPATKVGGLSSAGRYGNVVQQAMSTARGAAGVGVGMSQLQQRPSPLNEFYTKQTSTAKRPRNGTAQPQPRQQGFPGTPAQDRVAMMAAEVLGSDKTPLVAPISGASLSKFLPRR